jgi:hypothetical protein
MKADDLADSVFAAVKLYVSQSVAGLVKRADELERRLAALPVPQDGKDGKDAVIDEARLKMLIAELIPVPVNGKDGAPGENGNDGRDGNDGSSGKDGTDGLNGLPGRDGQDGADGKDGAKGDSGRDALEIEIVKAIDPSRVYPRGTWAKHCGGIVRAYRDTTHLEDSLDGAGWECVVNGLASIEIVSNGAREITVKTRFSDGSVIDKAFTFPAQIYRGIWKAGEYEHGDVVTRDGSTWHANAATTATPGSGSADWTMQTKRGANGKDYSPVAPIDHQVVRLR